jgi:tetratricopeptide (TPR) repeat protein
MMAVPYALAVVPALLVPAVGNVEKAERVAVQVLQETGAPPEDSLVRARGALELTAEFDPTDFVTAGRKGEVVEDEFVAARRAYRRHRALLYEAVGASQARAGEHRAAVRYLRRAVLLEPGEARVARLARSLLAVGRAPEALRLILGHGGAGDLSPASLALVLQAVDAAGFPSAQLEIDRVRLAAAVPGAVYRDGPFRLSAGGRLSSGAPLRLEDGLVVLYAADATCRSCSADLQELKRAVPAGVRVVLVPEAPDRDQALRQIAGLYKYDWPLLIGSGAAAELGLSPGSVLVVARAGWAGAVVKPPFLPALASALSLFGRVDVRETLPRPGWNGRPVDRRPAPPAPGLLPEGLAPGEDEPAPQEFDAAVAAYRTGRPAEALRGFETIENKGDGWLLPPEARLDRALALAALGRREEARRILLRIGDSRFQEEVDRALEKVGSAR